MSGWVGSAVKISGWIMPCVRIEVANSCKAFSSNSVWLLRISAMYIEGQPLHTVSTANRLRWWRCTIWVMHFRVDNQGAESTPQRSFGWNTTVPHTNRSPKLRQIRLGQGHHRTHHSFRGNANRLSFGVRQKFLRQPFISLGPNAAWRITEDGLTIAWCFTQTDVARNDGLKDFSGKITFHFLYYLLPQVGAAVIHRSKPHPQSSIDPFKISLCTCWMVFNNKLNPSSAKYSHCTGITTPCVVAVKPLIVSKPRSAAGRLKYSRIVQARVSTRWRELLVVRIRRAISSSAPANSVVAGTRSNPTRSVKVITC